MSRPRILDLFCGAGGASVGYHRAGFEVHGVDIAPQPNYPFPFVQRDALQFLAESVALDERYDAIHASPPCQAHSVLQKQNKRDYPDFVPQIRAALQAAGLPYVIENVEGAPLVGAITLCGAMFAGLRVLRHRLFECSFPVVAPAHPPHPLVFTHDKRKAHYGKLDQDTAFVQVTGGGNCTVANKRSALGIPWMTGHELNESIPPEYTRFVGGHLMNHIRTADWMVAA